MSRISRRKLLAGVAFLLVIGAVSAFSQTLSFVRTVSDPRTEAFWRWKTGDEAERAALTTSRGRPCPGAAFLLPAAGYIGLLYADPRPPYSASHLHQGIDIFSAAGPGREPVHAAYDGYLTRREHWRSAVIIRVPDDPLQPDRQIWLYYAHMADADGSESYIRADFPPGAQEVPVKRGELIGYVGNYQGQSREGVAVHLHFSIVKDDGEGHYLNEIEFDNTIDPSPYLGMALHYDCASIVPHCTSDPECP